MKLLRTIVICGACSVAPALGAQSIEGTWSGVAELKPDSGLPVSLTLAIRRIQDSLHVWLTLPESRQVRLQIPSPYSDSAKASFQGGRLRLEFTPDIGLAFIGGLGPANEERIVFDGQLEQSDRLVGTLRITRYVSPIVLTRARAPAHREVPVTFQNPNDSLRLGGTLLLPAGNVRPPVVVFVTGSDPDERNAWRYEAERLLNAGVGSLLYDKRGVGESSGASHDLASWDDLAGDLRGAIALLASRPDLVDTSRIGVTGQSQGTWIIAKVTATDPRVRFMVNIAGSGISGAEQETYRTGALMRAAGFAESEVARAQDFQRRKFRVARTGLGWQSLDSIMTKLRADSVKWFPGYGTGAAARSLAVLRLYGVLQFNYEPTPDLERIRVPTLVLMGQLDRTFPPAIVIERMRQSLARAGNRCVTTRIIPNATHGLLTVQGYRGVPFRRAINEEFLDVLTQWVSTRSRSRCT
ncbi:MAG: alpha/beta hydrolase family protein [Gemmatimonadaceae bacterium]